MSDQSTRPTFHGTLQSEFEKYLELLPTGVFKTDSNGHCVFVNQAWCRLTGMNKESALGSGWLETIHPTMKSSVTAAWHGALRESRPFDMIYPSANDIGQTHHLHCQANPIKADDGSVVGYLGNLTDVTSLKNTEDLYQFYKEALDQAAIVAITDAKGVITYANDMFCEISGYSREELIGKSHHLLNSGKMPTGYFQDMWRTISSGRRWQGEICNRAKNGTYYWVDTIIVPFFSRNGKIDRYVALRRDITKEKTQHLELIDASRKAELATKAKSDFLSTMSHEIRTPLNGIIGMTNLLQETQLSSAQKEFAEAISSSGKTLLALINDILDFSKIEAGKMELEPIEFELPTYLKDLLKTHQFTAEQKNLAFEVHIDPIPFQVIGDDGRIGQIVTNLVSNAIKFTKVGSITVRARVAAHGATGLLTLQVVDTGIGIPEQAHQRMFQAFSQAEQSTTRNYGGTGLGLSICHRLVEMMGGKIGFSSEYGSGTTFTLELPLRIGKPVTIDTTTTSLEANEQKLSRQQGKILVAEDNPINQKVIARMLELWGYRYLVVANGHEVLDVLREASFDLILMDCQMPEMDGYETTRIIRKSDSLKNSIPIVALTANAIQGDEDKCRAAGMNDYLTKPVNKKALSAILTKYLASQSESSHRALIDLTVFDKFKQLQAAGGSDIVIELIDAFIPTSKEKLTSIIQFHAKKDLVNLAKAAHHLKSSARVLGAKEVADICQKLEDAPQSEEAFVPQELIQELSTLIEKSQNELALIRAKRKNAA